MISVANKITVFTSACAELIVLQLSISVYDENFISNDKNRNYLLVQMIDPDGKIVFDYLALWVKRQKKIMTTFAYDCNLAAEHKYLLAGHLPVDKAIIMATCPLVSTKEKDPKTFIRHVGTKLQNGQRMSECNTPSHFALFLENKGV
jgi:hypothetical protein